MLSGEQLQFGLIIAAWVIIAAVIVWLLSGKGDELY